MSDHTLSFGVNVCAAVCEAVLHNDGDVDPELVTDAFDDELRAEYDRRVGGLRKALDLIDTCKHASADAAFALEQDLQTARDAEGDLFLAGRTRLDRALDAHGSSMTIAPHEFDRGLMTTYASPDDHDVETGDTILAAMSHKDTDDGKHMDVYPLFMGDTGLHCGGPDKNGRDDFPVCKHELVAMLVLAEDLASCEDFDITHVDSAYDAVLAHAETVVSEAKQKLAVA